MDVLDILWKWRVFWGKHTSGGFCFLSANIWGVGQKITRLHHGICPPSFRENTTHPQANYAPHPSLRTLDHTWVTFVTLQMDLKDKVSEAQGSVKSFWCCVSSEMARCKFRLIFLFFRTICARAARSSAHMHAPSTQICTRTEICTCTKSGKICTKGKCSHDHLDTRMLSFAFTLIWGPCLQHICVVIVQFTVYKRIFFFALC